MISQKPGNYPEKIRKSLRTQHMRAELNALSSEPLSRFISKHLATDCYSPWQFMANDKFGRLSEFWKSLAGCLELKYAVVSARSMDDGKLTG